MMIRSRGFTATAAVLALSTAAAAQEWKPSRLWVAGTQETAWVVGAAEVPGQNLPAVEMWCADRRIITSAVPVPTTSISGELRAVGADSDALRILFSDLTQCDYFSDGRYRPGPRWQDHSRAKPLAWAGDAKDPRFWALVETSQLVPLTPTTGQAKPTPPAEPSKSSAGRLTLLELYRGDWHRRPAPASAEKGAAFWLTGSGGEPVLIWNTLQRVFSSTWKQGEWTPPAEVLDHSVQYGWAGYSNGAVFVAGIEEEARGGKSEPPGARLLILTERDGQWKSLGEARDGNELLVIDPDTTGVGIARNELIVARTGAAGGVDFGRGGLSESPAVRFSHLAMRRPDSTLQNPWEDAIVFGVVLGLMTVTLIVRREEAARVLVLPAGSVPSAVWRRVIATIIDLFPAWVATAPWWYTKMMELWMLYGQAFLDDPGKYADQRLRYEIYAMILVYGFWCFVWEAWRGSTPGKMILGCRVLSTDGGRPTVGQCLARNVVRVLMVAMGAPGLLVTLMTIIIVTRNRQRIGDLLARTLVVEKDLSPPPDENPPDSEPPESHD